MMVKEARSNHKAHELLYHKEIEFHKNDLKTRK